MKRIITITSILIIILICSILGILYISSTNDQMNEYLNQSLVYLHSEDLTKANQEIESAQQLWEHAGKLINGYVNHEIIDTVEENLVRLNAHIKAQQIQQAKVIVKAIQFELNHLYECELPSLKNIF